MAKRRYTRRRRSTRRVRRKVRSYKRSRRMRGKRSIAPNVASIIESYDEICNFGISNTWGGLSLSSPMFDRAQQVAKAYREFRIKKIEFRFHFPFNSFEPNVAAEPRWWLMFDPRREIPVNFTKGLIDDMGIKPRRAIGQKKVIIVPHTMSPITEMAGAIGVQTTLPQGTRRRPWLPCCASAGFTNWGAWIPSTIQHHGLKWLATDPKSPPVANPYNVNVRVFFQFRKPVWYNSSSEPAPTLQMRNVLEDDEEEADIVVEEGEGGGVTCAPPPPPTILAQGGSSITPT